MPKKFPHIKQRLSSECGAVCLQMVAKYHGRHFEIEKLLALSRQKAEGVTLLGISDAAEGIGFKSVGMKLTFEELLDDIPLPAIAHWKGEHFVVIVEAGKESVTIADPAADDLVVLPVSTFIEGWTRSQDKGAEGVVLLLEPTPAFYAQEDLAEAPPSGLGRITHYLSEYKALLWLIFVCIVVGVLLLGLFPFIFKTMVDKGVQNQNPTLLVKILAVWIVLLVGKAALDLLQSALTSFVSRQVNVRLLIDFMNKVLALPFSFFQSRSIDDVIRLLYDNTRLQRFLTRGFASFFSALLLLAVYAGIMALFDWKIFAAFALATTLQGVTIMWLMKRRQRLDYFRQEHAWEHHQLLEDFLRGLLAIRLSNARRAWQWKWERSEVKRNYLDHLREKLDTWVLNLPVFIAELRNVSIIYLALVAVMNDNLSLGGLMAILFILTQLNNPLRQILDYLLSRHEVMGMMSRMDSVMNLPEAESAGTFDVVPADTTIRGENLSFHYDSDEAHWVLRNFNFEIQHGKLNCIVGPNGCGKTTLLNLLLGIYSPVDGLIKVGEVPLGEIRQEAWLAKCGVVPQDGYLFRGTIAENIAMTDDKDKIDGARLLEAASFAHVLDFIDRFPHGFKTMIGQGGIGLSRGQRQCILIARALYRQPEVLFLDEATNDLDEQTERAVLNDILEAFSGRTVVLFSSRMLNLPSAVRYIQMPPTASKRLAGNGIRGKGTFVPDHQPDSITDN